MTVNPEHFVPVSDFRANMPHYIDKLKDGPVYLLNHNKLVAAVTGIKEHNTLRAGSAVTPPLPERNPEVRPLSLEQLCARMTEHDHPGLSVPVGTCASTGEPVIVDLLKGNGWTMVSGSDTARQAFIATLILGLCRTHSSADLSFVLDNDGQQILEELEALPHCAGISTSGTSEARLGEAFSAEIRHRRELLREARMSTISEYLDQHPQHKTDLPYLVLATVTLGTELPSSAFTKSMAQLGIAVIARGRTVKINPAINMTFHDINSYDVKASYLPDDNSVMYVQPGSGKPTLVLPPSWNEDGDDPREGAPYNQESSRLFQDSTVGSDLIEMIRTAEHPTIRAHRLWAPVRPERVTFGRYFRSQYQSRTVPLFDVKDSGMSMGIRVDETTNLLHPTPAVPNGFWRSDTPNWAAAFVLSTVFAHANAHHDRAWILTGEFLHDVQAASAFAPLAELPNVVCLASFDTQHYRTLLEDLGAVGRHRAATNQEEPPITFVGYLPPTAWRGPFADDKDFWQRAKIDYLGVALGVALTANEDDNSWYPVAGPPSEYLDVNARVSDKGMLLNHRNPSLRGKVFTPLPDLGYIRHGRQGAGVKAMVKELLARYEGAQGPTPTQWWEERVREARDFQKLTGSEIPE